MLFVWWVLLAGIHEARRDIARRIDTSASKLEVDTAVQAVVETFDIEPFSDFSAKWSNFIGLVLFCIDAKFCKKIFVGISYLFEKKIEKRDSS